MGSGSHSVCEPVSPLGVGGRWRLRGCPLLPPRGWFLAAWTAVLVVQAGSDACLGFLSPPPLPLVATARRPRVRAAARDSLRDFWRPSASSSLLDGVEGFL